MQLYSNPERENDKWSLPDAEIFWNDGEYCGDCEEEDGEQMPEGYYYWYCTPGCMPEGDPIGPFVSAEEALAEIRANEE